MKNHHQRGGAAVEFGLVLPIFLLIIFSIVEFSLALYDKAIITNASREAARAGIVLKTPKLTTTQISNIALNYCQSNLITFGSASVPSVVVTNVSGTSFGQPLSVTVTFVYSGLSLGKLVSVLTGPLTLSATTVMNNE